MTPIEHGRCAIWIHRALILSVLGGIGALLGSGWLYLAARTQAAEIRVERHDAQLDAQETQLREIRGDLKELLRRVPGGKP